MRRRGDLVPAAASAKSGANQTHPLLGAIAACCLVAVPAQAAQYTIKDLGSLGGGSAYPTAINASGQVVGWGYTEGSNYRAFLHDGSVMHDLGAVGGTASEARGINDSGQVVGHTWTTGNTAQHAFLYSGGSMQDLATLGGRYSWGNAINAHGQVVGSSYPDNLASYAFIYSGGTMQSLGIRSSDAYGINDSGQVTGIYKIGTENHAFLYSGGLVQDLGTLGGSVAVGRSINASGQVAGYSYTTGTTDNHAFLYSGGSMQDLGTLGGAMSKAFSINAGGQVVGWAHTSSGFVKPFLYSGGSMVDLNTLLPPNSGWRLHQADAINDRGQIVGTGWNPAGRQTIFLLTPVPEPATLSLLMLGALARIRRRTRRR